MLSVEEIWKNGLCTGCGTCVGICPNSAIKMYKSSKGVYVPRVNIKNCNQCKICTNVCPGCSVDFNELNNYIFGKTPEDIIIGNYLNCYVGHSTNKKIQYDATSGGLVTTLLIFAFEQKMIDGALVTKMSDKNPLEPEVFIARTKEEIISTSKSKYCPVPANIALKEILSSKEGEKFAVVGLPCHIQGIRKAEMINKELKKKIILHFGLICNHIPTFLATDFLFQKSNVRKGDVKKMDYRGQGWPGGMSITLKNGNKKFIPYSSDFYWGIIFNSFFFPTRCMLCSDKTCELSDISFGDAWLPELSDDMNGESIIISRSKIGEKLLQNAITGEKIELNKINRNNISQSQGHRKNIKARILLFKMFGKKTPVYNQKLLEPKLIDYLNAVSLYLRISISSKRYFWNLLYMYWFLFKCAIYIKSKIEKLLTHL